METPSDLAMPFLLMATFRGLVDAVHAQLADAGFQGLQARHGFAMQAIGVGCTTVELGRRLGVSKQAAARTAGDLEALGLVTRVEHPHDRRARTLAPTQRGRQMLELSGEYFQRAISDWRLRAGDAAVDTTLRTLAQAGHGVRGPWDLSDWE